MTEVRAPHQAQESPLRATTAVSGRLPDYPWDKLTAYAAKARQHPGGVVDLSVGTPVDPTPQVVQDALKAASDSSGYPTTIGTPAVRQAAIDWLERCHGVTGLGPDGVLPVVGSKELIGSIALHLGVGAGDLIVYPELAYPTYEVGAALAGARALASDSLTALGPARSGADRPRILWLNSPSNPTGKVLPREHLRKVVEWCRERGTILISDECYIECAWEGEKPLSILHPSVSGGSHDGLLIVHSLSKRSNLAGYRCAFVAGDESLVGELLAVRKNLGLMVPGPIQAAMTAALCDDAHAREQHARYAARRAKLRDALVHAGFVIDHSEASLYLWARRLTDGTGEDCWATVDWLAERGILAAPGEFYGSAGREHVRIAFTATDERVDAAVERLTAG
ncbi:succinyldiaminopimelate transaminase [Nocardioides sp. BP30]|uniref:succinyldiaminopimelate transaminase n=1 Tax=Nocardioides sp. BP30 TaxID=3036374 RepID=UPI0024682CC7|nr:succinyldiaminopimelate transaminase [Nocardioides sp. BP30]WGL53461.1 succinyldiaminopimelate transaminase [Nocardioides sp. BP30]